MAKQATYVTAHSHITTPKNGTSIAYGQTSYPRTYNSTAIAYGKTSYTRTYNSTAIAYGKTSYICDSTQPHHYTKKRHINCIWPNKLHAYIITARQLHMAKQATYVTAHSHITTPKNDTSIYIWPNKPHVYI